MSAEVETTKDEESNKPQEPEPPRKTIRQHILANWQLGLKILQLLLCAVCIGTAYDAIKILGLGASDLTHVGVLYTAYTGYLLINTILIVGHILGDTIPYRTSALFSLSGAILFLVVAVLLLVDKSAHTARYSYDPNNPQLTMLLVSVIFALLNMIAMTLDAVFTFRTQRDF